MKQPAETKPAMTLPPFLTMMTRYGGRPTQILFWVLGIGLMFFGLNLAFNFFFLQGRVLMALPFLAQRASLDALAKEPGRFDNRWVRVEGLLWRKMEAQAVLAPVAGGPEPLPAKNAEPSPLVAPPAPHLEIRHPYLKAAKTMDFDVPDPNTVVEVVGTFHAQGVAGAEIVAAAMLKPLQLIYWVPVAFRGLISIVFILVALPFFVLARAAGKRPAPAATPQPLRDTLPKRITLSALDKHSFLKRADKSFIQAPLNFLKQQGFKTINMYTIPQLENYRVFVAFHHPEKRVYASICQEFGEDDLGTLTREIGRWIEFSSTYADATQVTTTTDPARALERLRPVQRGINVVPDADVQTLLRLHLAEMDKHKRRPLPVAAKWFEMALIESHILDHAWKQGKTKLTRLELLDLGRKMGLAHYEEFAGKLLEALEKAKGKR